MYFADFKVFDSAFGEVAVHPDAVVSIYIKPDGCMLHLTTGASITLSDDSLTVAKKLWGFVSQTDNGFFNAKHVLAITATFDGCRLHLTGGTNLDTRMSVSMMVRLQQESESLRSELIAGRSKDEQ